MTFIIYTDYSITWNWRALRVLQDKGQTHPCQDIFLSSHDIQDPPVEKLCYLITCKCREHHYLSVRDDCTYFEMVQQIFGDS